VCVFDNAINSRSVFMGHERPRAFFLAITHSTAPSGRGQALLSHSTRLLSCTEHPKVALDMNLCASRPPEIRTLVKTDYGAKLAISQRKTYENFLICGDRAYVRGGLPVYFRNSHGHKNIWEIDITSAGRDRRGDPKTHGLEHPPGSFQDHRTEQAFGSGTFWLPNEFAAAKSAGHRLQTKFPRIEVLMPDLLVDARQRIRLDSLFREVVRMFSHPFCDYWSSRAVASFRKKFEALCDPVIDDHELSRRRLELLREFCAQIDDGGYWEMDRIRRDIISFDVQERCSPTWPEPMAAEDDEALGSLAS
jgi:hypothetical protein